MGGFTFGRREDRQPGHLARALNGVLRSQGDPWVLGYGDIFDSYPHYAPQQPSIGGFKQHGEYNPAYWRLAQNRSPSPLKKNKVQ